MNMVTKRISKGVIALCSLLLVAACTPSLVQRTEKKNMPQQFGQLTADTTNTVAMRWNTFFKDPNLLALIDTALRNNQELNIMLQEMQIARNEVRARKGEYLPFVDVGGGAGVERVGKYTRSGAVEETDEIKPGTKFPNPLPDFMLGAYASWEVDVWNKLRTARKSAMFRYLATTEGKNFMVTHLVSEIANSYYELMALDNQLDILRQNIEIQNNALEIVRLEKSSARVTELAVRKFEAEVYKNRSRQYDIKQRIIETENRINFLVGRFPQPITRNSATFQTLLPDSIHAGVPMQLLDNRPDIRQAELDLTAAKLDVKVAKANFYPSVHVNGGVGYQSFSTKYLITPASVMYSIAGDVVGPLINRNALKAYYYSANARQMQAVYHYEQTMLSAYIEVANQLAMIGNLQQSYSLREQQVQALTQSITIASNLFRSARADYMEVLMTQRDGLESRMELVETKKMQLMAVVNVYRALGGGWK